MRGCKTIWAPQKAVVFYAKTWIKEKGKLTRCSPVIREVFWHLARGAISSSAHVAGHSYVEGISTNDVMNMRRRALARLTGGIEALKGESWAWETKAGLDKRSQRRNGVENLHLCDNLGEPLRATGNRFG